MGNLGVQPPGSPLAFTKLQTRWRASVNVGRDSPYSQQLYAGQEHVPDGYVYNPNAVLYANGGFLAHGSFQACSLALPVKPGDTMRVFAHGGLTVAAQPYSAWSLDIRIRDAALTQIARKRIAYAVMDSAHYHHMLAGATFFDVDLSTAKYVQLILKCTSGEGAYDYNDRATLAAFEVLR